MTGVLKILVLMTVVTAVAACGTVQLNQLVTGTNCETKEDCVKDLNLPNPPNPDVVFVVEPLLMDEKEKAPLGTPAFNSPVWYGDVDLCVAKSLKEEFTNAAILLDVKKAKSSFIDITLKSIRAQGHGGVMSQ